MYDSSKITSILYHRSLSYKTSRQASSSILLKTMHFGSVYFKLVISQLLIEFSKKMFDNQQRWFHYND